MPLLWETSFILLGAVVGVPLIMLNIRLAPRLGLIDWPKARGVAEEQVPIVGHGLVLATLACMGVLNFLHELSPWFITTASLMAIMGHLDDRRPLPAIDKMFFQVLCVGTVVALDPSVEASMTEKYGVFGAFITAVFMVGLVNAINFIDGIDGLAGIVIAVGALGLVLLNLASPAFYPHHVLGMLILGLMFPFLFFNVRRRRGFLGNIGSYFFSFCLAVLHISMPLPSPDVISRLSLSGLCFLIPLADSLMVIMNRLFTLRSPFQPDKGHLHHRLIQTSIPLRWILFYFGIIELAAMVVAVMLSRSRPVGSVLPAFICVSHIAISGILILLVEKASRRRIQAYFQRMDGGEPIYFLKYRFTRPDGSPVPFHQLRRLEARVSAEIRVTDLCFAERPNTLFVTLKTLPEPLKGISGRLDAIFQAEKLSTNLVVDQGEFVKVSRDQSSHRKLG